MSLSESASSIPTTQQVRGRIHRRDHLRREGRRRVDDHEVVAASAGSRTPRGGRSSRSQPPGPAGAAPSAPAPRRMPRQELVDLLGVERAARDGEVVDRLCRLAAPSARPTSPNCRSRSTSTADLPSSASATARLEDVTVLPVPPFGPEHGDHRSLGHGDAAAPPPRQRLLEREAELPCRLWQRNEVVGAGLEGPLQEPVRRPVVENDDRPVRPAARSPPRSPRVPRRAPASSRR